MQSVHTVDDNPYMLLFRMPVVSDRWWPASAAALLWALAAGSVVFWWLQSPRQGQGLNNPVHEMQQVAAGPPGTAAVARALGQGSDQPAAPEASRRFELQGLISTDSGHGSALLVVDGQPAKVYVHGQEVVDGWLVHSVSSERLVLRSQAMGDKKSDIVLSLSVKYK